MSMTTQGAGVPFRTLCTIQPHFPMDARENESIRERDWCGSVQRDELDPRASSQLEVLQGALIDRIGFTRACLIDALSSKQSGIALRGFETAEMLVSSGVRDVDVILYHQHNEDLLDVLRISAELKAKEAFASIPAIVLSDGMTAVDPETMATALRSGVRGFISTRAIEISAVSAAIRFVKAGGVVATAELLLTYEAERTATQDGSALPSGLLTPRQTTVLCLLQQGKPNKTIARELQMSESTVKVHLRNIMRKIGATNRTQALYKWQQFVRDHHAPGGPNWTESTPIAR
jgi:DNA-binding NarL/FixJ family response regulator